MNTLDDKIDDILEAVVREANDSDFTDGKKLPVEQAKQLLLQAFRESENQIRSDERSKCVEVFEQKMTNLGIKWGRIHKSECECGDIGCLKELGAEQLSKGDENV